MGNPAVPLPSRNGLAVWPVLCMYFGTLRNYKTEFCCPTPYTLPGPCTCCVLPVGSFAHVKLHRTLQHFVVYYGRVEVYRLILRPNPLSTTDPVFITLFHCDSRYIILDKFEVKPTAHSRKERHTHNYA